MRIARISPLVVLSVVALSACKNEAKEQLQTLAHVDSIRVDSLANVRRELLDEVMSSTQFVAQINTELAKARSLANKTATKLETSGEIRKSNEDRKTIVARISMLVARLDSVQSRLASTRARAQQLSQKDSALVAQVAVYEKSIADLQAAAEKQRSEFQVVIDRQTTQIATLNTAVDTLTRVRTALTDTVGQLVSEKNTAYYIIGTKQELIDKGILSVEGGRRFLLVGSRPIAPARELDPSKFTKIDRLSSRTITLPEGEYQILSRQSPSFIDSSAVNPDGKIVGALTIQRPEQFWEPSRFLIIVKA